MANCLTSKTVPPSRPLLRSSSEAIALRWGGLDTLHVENADSAHAVRRVGSAGRRTRRGWAGPLRHLGLATVGEPGPSVLRLLSSTDEREHVPHARQGSVRTRDS